MQNLKIQPTLASAIRPSLRLVYLFFIQIIRGPQDSHVMMLTGQSRRVMNIWMIAHPMTKPAKHNAEDGTLCIGGSGGGSHSHSAGSPARLSSRLFVCHVHSSCFIKFCILPSSELDSELLSLMIFLFPSPSRLSL